MEKTFRKSLFGFSSKDVVDYLNTITETHQTENLSLKKENEVLSEELNALRALFSETEQEIELLRQKENALNEAEALIENAKHTISELQAISESLQSELQEAEKRIEALKGQF